MIDPPHDQTRPRNPEAAPRYPPGASAPRSPGRRRWMARGLGLAAGAGSLALGSAALAQPLPLHGLRLLDHREQPLDKARLGGRPVLMHFIFTQCATLCPVQVAELVQVHQALPADVQRDVRFVSVTVDPLSDTPTTLAAYARRMQADRPGWSFATGHPEQVHQLLERLQVWPKPGQPARPDDHRTTLFLFARDGVLLQRFGGAPVDRVRLQDELTRLTRRRAT